MTQLHRFFRHQPDLNGENPAVREAILPVIDSWLDRGVDRMRLDAAPYLVESVRHFQIYTIDDLMLGRCLLAN
jgi:glycosidase